MGVLVPRRITQNESVFSNSKQVPLKSPRVQDNLYARAAFVLDTIENWRRVNRTAERKAGRETDSGE